MRLGDAIMLLEPMLRDVYDDKPVSYTDGYTGTTVTNVPGKGVVVTRERRHEGRPRASTPEPAWYQGRGAP